MSAEMEKPAEGVGGTAPPPAEVKPTTPPGAGTLRAFFDAFLPNRVVSPGVMRIVIAGEVLLFLLVWFRSPFDALPRPGEVFSALRWLWITQGLGRDLFISFRLNVVALFWTTVISLLLSYLTVLPAFRPIVTAASKARFLSLFGFTFVFTIMVGGGYPLQLWLLVFAMTVFFLTSMASVIEQI